MRKSLATLFAVSLVGMAGIATASSAEAVVKVKTYKNCTALNRDHKGGVARTGAKDKRASGRAKYKPTVSNALYAANKGLDRDRDGIACER